MRKNNVMQPPLIFDISLSKQEGGMKRHLTNCLLLAMLLLPLGALAAEPAKGVPFPAIDPILPIHQQKKLHPEISDPVLGDQSQIVEWAWSPQYAERFGLQPQQDGLPNGGLWLVGVKIKRQQYQLYQRYTCNIVGVMDNRLKILTPPGDVYVAHPSGSWSGGLPGKAQVGTEDMKNEVGHQAVKPFTPAQATWNKNPKNNLEKTRSERNIGLSYLIYYRHFQSGLSYFELTGSCAYFNDPVSFRNEIRFPARFIHENRTATFESDAIHFDIPDSLMRRIYLYTQEADDWTSCLLRRIGLAGMTLTLRAIKSKRFGNTCEAESRDQK